MNICACHVCTLPPYSSGLLGVFTELEVIIIEKRPINCCKNVSCRNPESSLQLDNRGNKRIRRPSDQRVSLRGLLGLEKLPRSDSPAGKLDAFSGVL